MALVLFLGTNAFADSTFLPAFEFCSLYKDNKTITTTKEKGISKSKYLKFLLSNKQTLGEKVALIDALATYFEFIDMDKTPVFYDYFPDYTIAFKQKLTKLNKVSPELHLLETLMDDYLTFTPNIKRYDELAAQMPTSLTAQTIKVLAFAYDILYNRKWNLIEDYQNKYLSPYNDMWQNYNQDIKLEVHTTVNEWLRFITQREEDQYLMSVIEENASLSEKDSALFADYYDYDREEGYKGGGGHPIDLRMEDCIQSSQGYMEKEYDCIITAYTEWKNELDKYYKLLMGALPKAFHDNLRAYQDKWIAYCESEEIFLGKIYLNTQPTMWKYGLVARKLDITKQRALELQYFYELATSDQYENVIEVD